MPCNRRDCPGPGDHAHLRWQDEHAIANVLAAREEERRGRRELARRQREREQARQQGQETR